jgi:hypothetical protein
LRPARTQHDFSGSIESRSYRSGRPYWRSIAP